jgi:hypothetical protein
MKRRAFLGTALAAATTSPLCGPGAASGGTVRRK